MRLSIIKPYWIPASQKVDQRRLFRQCSDHFHISRLTPESQTLFGRPGCGFLKERGRRETHFFIKRCPSRSLSQGCAVCPFPFTLCCLLAALRNAGDGWQLFADSMARLISSVCFDVSIRRDPWARQRASVSRPAPHIGTQSPPSSRSFYTDRWDRCEFTVKTSASVLPDPRHLSIC